jgi:hypothetical protein
MTWYPIWTTANKILIYPLVIPSLSYGLYVLSTYAGRSQQRAFREVAERRRSRDEPLVAEFIRSEIP